MSSQPHWHPSQVWVLCPPPQRSPFDVGALALARERERGTRERVSPEDVLGGPGGPQQAQQAQLLPASKRSLAGSDVPRASVMAQLLRWGWRTGAREGERWMRGARKDRLAACRATEEQRWRGRRGKLESMHCLPG